MTITTWSGRGKTVTAAGVLDTVDTVDTEAAPRVSAARMPIERTITYCRGMTPRRDRAITR
jgi:hypothetical protein